MRVAGRTTLILEGITDAQRASSAALQNATAGRPLGWDLHVRSVQRFSLLVADRGHLFLGALKRQVSKRIYEECNSGSASMPPRPHGLDVEALVSANPELFHPGRNALEPGSHRLQVDEMARWHAKVCRDCQWNGTHKPSVINPSCYFSLLLPCLERGWDPPFLSDNFIPPYQMSGNYESTALYREGVAKELLGSMLANGAIRKCNPQPSQIVHPLGAVIKNSDKTRALTLVGVAIADQHTLGQANALLEAKGWPKVKVRVTMDCTATGVNAAALSPRFSYPSVKDGLEIVYRNCWLVVSDVSRYFHSFPWSAEMRKKMCVEWDGDRYECLGLSFGFTACPYYCSTWSAEFRRWVKAHIGECAHMVDDWLLVGDTQQEAQGRGEDLAEMFHSVGLGMQTEKNVCDQVLKYLGIVIDTVSMTLRIDPVQAMGTRLLLQEVRAQLGRGTHPGHGTLYHIAGKLNWFSEVLQSGRLHTHSFWNGLRVPPGKRIPTQCRGHMERDIDWWCKVLRRWENQRGAGSEYRILSAAELQSDPAAIYLIQSDASGEDGVGFAHGRASDQDLQWGSAQWEAGGRPASTHAMELHALRVCLESEQFTAQNCSVLWVTDSTSAALSVNKGNCASPEGYSELEIILELCDEKGLELLAFWVPREENLLADYLSHLSAMLGRERVHGTTSELAAAIGKGPRGGESHSLDATRGSNGTPLP